jgi:putative PIN family toxin of toxin-antitoxin system
VRVVFDTVVLVRGLIGPYSLWGQLLFDFSPAYELVVSADIVQEYLEVIHRPRISRKFRPATGRDLAAMLKIISKATTVEPSHVPMICRDPEDDKFLAVAIASQAAFIVTEDTDLLDLEAYASITICSARQFYERVLDERDGPRQKSE